MSLASSEIQEKHGTAVWHTLFMAIAGVAILWLGWQFRLLHAELQRIRSHDYRLVELAGEIVHLDEVLTMSARMAAATLDPAWDDRYHRFEPQLDDAIKESIRLEPGTVSRFIAETDAANRSLVEMEERSFEAVRRKDQHAAAAILSSPEYERQKKLYSNGIQWLAAAVNTRADAAMAAQNERMNLVMVILLVVLAVLSLFWIALSRASRQRVRVARRDKQVAERARDGLEIRVAEGTADLRRGRDLLQDMIDYSPSVIYAMDIEGHFILANTKSESTLGVSQGELIGKTRHDILPAEAANRGRCNDLEVIQTGRPVVFEEEYSETDGRHVYYTVKFPLIDSTGKTYAIGGISSDITDRKRAEEEKAQLEEQFQQAQKTECIGRLASGVAHDFNNLLMVILGQSELLAARLGPDHPLSARVLEIDDAAQRASSLTRQLLTFSRRQAWEPEVIDLNTRVSNMDKMLQRVIGEDIELTSRLGPSLGNVRADPSQIDQVIMNLVVNARDAMPQGGRITIRTENVEIPDGTGNTRAGVSPGAYVLLAVCDSGRGIDESIRSRIFEPFFTTKDLGKGTGLGLSMVCGIVKRNNGYIDVESTMGAGTTFTVLLPRVRAAEESTRKEIGNMPAQAGRETVLVDADGP